MGTFFYLAVIATFFATLILSLGRIVGSHEFKESRTVALLTILNMVTTMYIGVWGRSHELLTETPFMQMLVFSIITSIFTVGSVLYRIPAEPAFEVNPDTVPLETTVASSPVDTAPVAVEHNSSSTSTPGRSRTKPVIARDILEGIQTNNGGTVLVAHDTPVEELAP